MAQKASGMPAACPECGGTGYISRYEDGMPVGRPCACRQQVRSKLRMSGAGIPERYAHCEFESFAPLNPDTTKNRSLELALRSCRQVVSDFPSSSYGLLLSGPCGTGKTHLAVAVLRMLILQKGARGLFAEFYDLLRQLQETYEKNSARTTVEVLQPALDVDVLVLDDLGATRVTAWARDTLGQILNERYNQRRLTLVTTNRSLEGSGREESLADRVGERIASRLAEMCIDVRIDAADFRREKIRNRARFGPL